MLETLKVEYEVTKLVKIEAIGDHRLCKKITTVWNVDSENADKEIEKALKDIKKANQFDTIKLNSVKKVKSLVK